LVATREARVGAEGYRRGSIRMMFGRVTSSDLVDRVIEAMNAPELERSPWHPDYFSELACAAMEAVRPHELENR
jgi:hypothetical protein